MDEEGGTALALRLGEDVTFKKTDVSDAEQVQQLVSFAVERYGGLDVMFNNAGISGAVYHRFLEDDLKDFDRVVRVNLFGVMIGSHDIL